MLRYFADAWRYALYGDTKTSGIFAATLTQMAQVGAYQFETGNVDAAMQLAVTSAWVWSDIKLIADRIASRNNRPVVKIGDDDEEVKDHPFLKLLDRPNAVWSGGLLLRYITWWYLLYGNAYLFISTEAPGRGEPQELWPLPANAVKPLSDTLRRGTFGRDVIDYEYTVQGMPQRLPGENMVHLRTANPFDYWQGLSPLTAALMGVQTDTSESKWVRDFFARNNATPNAILSLPATVGTTDFNRIKEQLKEQLESGQRRIITRAGDLKVDVIQQTLEQMQVVQSRAFSRDEIDRVYGVPQGLVSGALSGDSRTAAEVTFSRNTIQPLLDYICDEWTANVGPFYGDDVRIEAPNTVPQDRSLAVQEYAMYSRDRTVNENRAEQGLGESSDPNAEIPVRLLELYVKSGGTPAPGTPSLPGAPAPAQEVAVQAGRAAEMARWKKVALKEARAGRDPAARGFESAVLGPETVDAIRLRLAGADEATVRAIFGANGHGEPAKVDPGDQARAERSLEDKLSAILDKYRGKIAAAIKAGQDVGPLLDELASELAANLSIGLSATMTDATMAESESVGVDFDVAVVNGEAARWAREYAYDQVRGITDTSRAAIANAVEQFARSPGMTVGQLSEMLTPAFGPARAKMIAVTETTRAYAEASRAAQRYLAGYGLTMKRVWKTSADDIVCPVCGPLNGKPEGEWGGLDGPPAHVNCRCVVTLKWQE
jgi:HK97 family phage portal protein